MDVVVPQPAMRRYVAIVVVKLPELEKIAIDPLRNASSGWSPPNAPPMRTWFHASATPRLLPPKMSTPLACPIARIVHGELLGDDEDLLQLRVDPDQFGHTIARRCRRQVDHAAVEAMAGVDAFKYVVVNRHRAKRRFQHLASFARRRAEHDIAA